MSALLLIAALSATIVQTTEPGAELCTTVTAAAGPYYVRALAIDSEVHHSALSNEVLKILPDDVCWTNPTKNIDQSLITDLAAVEIVWSPDPIVATPDDPTCAPVIGGPVFLLQEETVFVAQAIQVGSQSGKYVLFAVGTVPAGTMCNPGMAVDVGTGLHGQVPNTAVVWTSPTGARPFVVVARCNG